MNISLICSSYQCAYFCLIHICTCCEIRLHHLFSCYLKMHREKLLINGLNTFTYIAKLLISKILFDINVHSLYS